MMKMMKAPALSINLTAKIGFATISLIGLSALSACASVNNDSETIRTIEVTETIIETSGPNLNMLASQDDFNTTLARAVAGIDKRGFKTFAVIDHAAGARSIDQDLRPTTLVIFGNPAGGTPLMQSAQTMGIELPLKMLVHQDASGQTHVSWPKMDIMFQEHGVNDRDPVLAKITGALQAIANEATDNELTGNEG